jgi:Spy/CpxP family protein refolding chaperone
MIPLLSLMISLSGPLAPSECCFNPEPGQKPASGTSSRALHFAPRQGPPQISDDEKERNRIRLGISQAQQAQIDDLYKETQSKMGDVWKAMRDKQGQLRETYRQYELDESKAKMLRIDIVRLHKKMGEIQLENERKIRTILTREQFDKLQQLMKEKFDQFRKNRPGGPPP